MLHNAILSLPLLLLLLLVVPPTAPARPPDLAACLLLSNVHNFSLAGNSSFYRRLLNFSIQNLRFSRPHLPRPIAVILPHDLSSLRSSVLCCRAASLTVRLRSGGHSYEGLSYAAPGGTPFALIDVMNLHRVYVDAADRTAWLQSGATLGQLYHAISTTAADNSPQHLAFPGGSCPTVGAGGHIAGGGFGLLSRKHGLAADNVIDAVVVSPDGRVLDRAAMGEAHFWAIRGGGGGAWGAVYGYKIQLQTIPNPISAFIVNRVGSHAHIADLINKWQKSAPILPDEFYLSCFVGRNLPESGRAGMSATFRGLYLGPARQARPILTNNFPDLNLKASEIKTMSWIESVLFFSGLENGSSVGDLRDRELRPKTFFKAKSDYVKSLIDLRDLIKMIDRLSKEPKAYLIMDPYGGEMAKRGSEDLPFPHRAGNLYAIQHLIEWGGDEDGGREGYIRWMRDWYEFMGPMVSSDPRAAYVNYLDLDLGFTTRSAAEIRRDDDDDDDDDDDLVNDARVWGEKYYLENFDRLVQVKTSVDPDNMFCNEQSIPPLKLGDRSVQYEEVQEQFLDHFFFLQKSGNQESSF